MDDLISRQTPIEARRYTFGNDEFSLEYAYHDCKLVFDGITDDDSFQKADTGLILYYANEIIYALQEALEGKDTNVPTNDCISRQDAVDIINGYAEQFNGYIGTPNDSEVYAYARGLLLSIERNISALPSAQLEIEERMSETEQNVPNDDFISRKGAIDAIEAVFPVDPMKSEYAQGIACGAALSKTYIEQLSSAQPKQLQDNCEGCYYKDRMGYQCESCARYFPDRYSQER